MLDQRETTPSGGTPIEGTALSDPYVINGVTVSFQLNLNPSDPSNPSLVNPIFVQAGGNPSSGFFDSFTGTYNTARPGFEAQLGNFFLATPGFANFGPSALIITYTSVNGPVTAASGEIWDIEYLLFRLCP